MLQSVYLTLFHQYSVYLPVFIFLLFFPFHILYSICVSWKCRRTSSPWQTVGYLLVNVSLATVNRFQQIELLKHSTLKKSYSRFIENKSKNYAHFFRLYYPLEYYTSLGLIWDQPPAARQQASTPDLGRVDGPRRAIFKQLSQMRMCGK